MSKTLVTGATGTIGNAVARLLIERHREVRVLVRDEARARTMLPDQVETILGDLTDAESIAAAVKGCSSVYHCGGLPEGWQRDKSLFEKVNVGGTKALIEASLAQGVDSFIYTSTIDVFERQRGVQFDESRLAVARLGTHYERSKQKAEQLVAEAVTKGLPARVLHPSAVFGPAPVIAAGLNDVIHRLALRKIPLLLPGGMPAVYARDVAEGHLAAERAEVGSRYILSDDYLTLRELAVKVRAEVPNAKVPPVLPTVFAWSLAQLGEAWGWMTGAVPMIPRGQLHFLRSEVRPSSALAQKELGWRITAFDDGLSKTLEHLRATGALP